MARASVKALSKLSILVNLYELSAYIPDLWDVFKSFNNKGVMKMLLIHTPNRDLFMSLLVEKIKNLNKKDVINNREKDLLERCKSTLSDFEHEIQDEDDKNYELLGHKENMSARIEKDLYDHQYVANCWRCGFPFAASLSGYGDTIEGELMCSSCQKNYQL